MISPPYENWNSLVEAVDDCEACDIATPNKIFGDGNADAKLVLVGEGPGKFEEIHGVPFAGRSGELLNQALVKVGIDRDEDTYITNVIRCRSCIIENDMIKDRSPPLQSEVSSCSPFLHATLKFLQPKAICTLGLTAASALLPDAITTKKKPSMSDYRKMLRMGKSLHYTNPYSPKKAVPVIVAWHPSYVLRSRSTNRFDELAKDLAKAFKLSKKHG